MRIFLTGLCTVHWGRLEFGNIGNYYITETSIRELHRVFPDAEIVTTFQMTDEFCKRERITCLPMELFYSWSKDDVEKSLFELGIATVYHTTGKLPETTPYIQEVMKSDLVVDFSGEMWGDHAEPVGKNRFLVDLIKDRVAQLLNKPVVLLAGSQGPFSDPSIKEFAKEVFKDFKLVANREPASADLLLENGFDISKVKNFACPAFLFEPKPDTQMVEIFNREKIIDTSSSVVGYILCGFNMLEGPYDKAPRKDEEFDLFAESIEYIVNDLGARVIIMSHQNGFELPPNFKLIPGRDYVIAKQLYDVVMKRGKVKPDDVSCLKTPYTPGETKAIIKHYDMFISGRVHAFVAAISQSVPSVLINRGFGQKSHRNIGFARSVGIEDYLADPHSINDMKSKISKCWENRTELRKFLDHRIPEIQNTARMAFDELRNIT
jgi:colanic acid/amylovoran biosynthesis protein